MPRRLTLSPLQRDLLLMLEEAGAETVGTVITTLKPPDQGEFAAQVNGLVTLGLIRKEENHLVLTEQDESLYGLSPKSVGVKSPIALKMAGQGF